jgi:hypothetical protein
VDLWEETMEIVVRIRRRQRRLTLTAENRNHNLGVDNEEDRSHAELQVVEHSLAVVGGVEEDHADEKPAALQEPLSIHSISEKASKLTRWWRN